jgi:hypothetical protein
MRSELCSHHEFLCRCFFCFEDPFQFDFNSFVRLNFLLTEIFYFAFEIRFGLVIIFVAPVLLTPYFVGYLFILSRFPNNYFLKKNCNHLIRWYSFICSFNYICFDCLYIDSVAILHWIGSSSSLI